MIVNKDTGQLEQVIFFKAWREDWKGLTKPSLTDSRLIKLKALQLLVSAGREGISAGKEGRSSIKLIQ